MKKKNSARRILIYVIFLGLSNTAFSQRHIKGQYGLTPNCGLVDRIPSQLTWRQNQQGFVAGLDFVRYTKNGSYWKIGYTYDVKYYSGPANSAPGGFYQSSRQLISWEYVPQFLYTRNHTGYISPALGVNLGYEAVNNNQRNVPEGRILSASSGLLGVQVGVESELYLAEKTALVLALQERYLPFSNLSKLHTYGTVGVRFVFFTE